mgnify:FL=1
MPTFSELQAKYGLSEQEIQTKWEAFSLRNNNAKPDAASLESFAISLSRNNKTKPRSILRQLPTKVEYKILDVTNTKVVGSLEPSNASQQDVEVQLLSVPKRVKYFNDSLDGISRTLKTQLKDAEQIFQAFLKTELANGCRISQSTVWCVGRICRDLDSTQPGGPLYLENGERVLLNLQNIDEKMTSKMFPGKIVALEGKNPRGAEFIATSVRELPMLPLHTVPTIGEIETRVGIVRASAGDELRSLLAHVAKQNCSVVIVLGLPVPSTAFLHLLKQFRMQFVLLPSLDDTLSVPVYPQNAYNITHPKLHTASNPTRFLVNNELVLCSSAPVISDLGQSNPNKLFSFAEKARAILTQRQAYPLFPALIPLDMSSIEPSLTIESPNLLILQGDNAAEVVDGVFCVSVDKCAVVHKSSAVFSQIQ